MYSAGKHTSNFYYNRSYNNNITVCLYQIGNLKKLFEYVGGTLLHEMNRKAICAD